MEGGTGPAEYVRPVAQSEPRRRATDRRPMTYYRQDPHRSHGTGITIGVPGVTPVVRALIVACGAVWLLQVLLYAAGYHVEGYLGVVPARVARGWIFQVGTYLFLHSPREMLHILLNMLILWLFGSDLERHWGGRAFLRYYLVCGVGGGVFAAALGLLRGGPHAEAATIGASGAIFGVIVAFGTVFAERPVLFMMLFPMRARTMAMILFAVSFFYTVVPDSGNVSHIGHLGGAVVGFLFLRRAWRVGDFVRELRWRVRRRRFRVMQPGERDDSDRWVN
jgi:membrane associated rhomboid family serine protease